ncbi:MAG: fibronectin type III domain-containing protein [Bacteroidota bacterium]
MKKILFGLSGLLLIGLIIVSCSKEYEDDIYEDSIQKSKASTRTLPGEQDVIFRDLAKATSFGINKSVDLRSLLKEEALVMFDGDFDVLLETIKDRQITVNNRTLTVKKFLGTIYKKFNLSVTYTQGSNGGFNGGNNGGNNGGDNGDGNGGGTITVSDPNEIIETIISIFPEIQISIPVHAEDWDVYEYIPPVIYIPEDYDESTTLLFDGYQDCDEITLDAVVPPDNPALVVGLCERLDKGIILKKLDDVEIILTTSTTATGISLSWTVNNSTNEDITGYNIYRKGALENEFILIHVNDDEYNSTYFDNNVDELISYSYYVRAYNAISLSEKSNTSTIAAPSGAKPPADFSATLFATDVLELRWTQEEGNYVESSTLSKRLDTQAGYQEIGNFPNTVNDFFDPVVIEGNQVIYRIVNHSPLEDSDPKYDIVDVPFRDVSAPAPVRIEKITIEDPGSLEGWGRGAPEFRVGIVRTGSDGNPVVVQENLHYDMFWFWPHELPVDELVLNWYPGNSEDVLTFRVMERDGGPDLDDILDAEYIKKNSAKTSFIISAATAILNKFFDDSDDEIGRSTHRYSDPVDDVLEFPTAGFKIHLSE